MNFLRQALADYLAVRRALGYRLARAEKLLTQFLAFVEDRGEEHLTIETALAWGGAGRRRSELDVQASLQHSPVRHHDAGLTCYPGAAGGYPARSITPSDAVPVLDRRGISTLMAVTAALRGSHRKTTYRTLIGLLAATGMQEKSGRQSASIVTTSTPSAACSRSAMEIRQISRVAVTSQYDRRRWRLSPPRRSSSPVAERPGLVPLAGGHEAALYERAEHIPAACSSCRHHAAFGGMPTEAARS